MGNADARTIYETRRAIRETLVAQGIHVKAESVSRILTDELDALGFLKRIDWEESQPITLQAPTAEGRGFGHAAG